MNELLFVNALGAINRLATVNKTGVKRVFEPGNRPEDTTK